MFEPTLTYGPKGRHIVMSVLVRLLVRLFVRPSIRPSQIIFADG